MNRFRPQDNNKRYLIKQRRKYGYTDLSNWQTRVDWWPPGYGLNQQSISRRFSQLHYLACHAPKPVAKKWRSAYNQFEKKHFTTLASVRYANKYSCDAWL